MKTQDEIDRERRQMAEEIVRGQNLTTLEEAKEFATKWIVTAAQESANAEFYRGVRDKLLAQGAHCLSRDCLRGSPAGNREYARTHPDSFRAEGCECGCGNCVAAPTNEETPKTEPRHSDRRCDQCPMPATCFGSNYSRCPDHCGNPGCKLPQPT
jgi:hypothetical protein